MSVLMGIVAGALRDYGLDFEDKAIVAAEIVTRIENAAGGPDHIVHSKGAAWTIQHPLSERFEGQLFNCPYVALIQTAAMQGAFGDGTHRVWLDRNALQWEEVGT